MAVKPNTSLSQTTPPTLGGVGVSCPHHRRSLPLVLGALIVLDVPVAEVLIVVIKIPNVPVVELLVVVVKIAGRLGKGILGAAAAVGPIVLAAFAFGPARASRDGLARCSVARSIQLLVVVVLGLAAVVRATIARCPARASQDGLDEATRFVASGNAGLEALVVLAVDLLLVRVKVVSSVVLLGDGGSLGRLGEAFLGAAAVGPIIQIAVELDGLRPAALGGRLRLDEAKEEGLLAVKLLPGRRAVRLLPRGPACRLCFRHAAIDLGPTSGIPASREGNEVV